MRIGARTMLLYSAGSVGAGVFYAFNNFLLPLALKAVGAPDLITGLLSSTRSVEGVVVQPTVGAASDRIWTRLGRRRPSRVQIRSEAAPTVGCTTTPSTLRVLERRPV